MKKGILAGLIIIVILCGGVYYYFNKDKSILYKCSEPRGLETEFIKFHVKNTEAKKIFEIMSKKSGLDIVYNQNLMGTSWHSFDFDNISVEDMLDRFIVDKGLSYELKGNQVIIKKDITPHPINIASTNKSITTPNLDVVIPRMSINNANINSFLRLISNSSGMNINVSSDVNVMISEDFENTTLRKVLDETLPKYGLTYKINGDEINITKK